ncbi:hypothetical protein ABZ953_30175 [Streptomyces sp. NPDC046465]|uniref:hypothetical protein n=1 Tax=Streptomyces sp. NPDC046465 TaxID=3155810 RepID=UPI0033DD5790
MRAAGVEFESTVSFAGLHQVLRPLLTALGRLTDVYRRALSAALGLDDGAPSEQLLVPNLTAPAPSPLAAAPAASLDARAALELIQACFPSLAPRVRSRLPAEAQGNLHAVLDGTGDLGVLAAAGAMLPSEPVFASSAPALRSPFGASAEPLVGCSGTDRGRGARLALVDGGVHHAVVMVQLSPALDIHLNACAIRLVHRCIPKQQGNAASVRRGPYRAA